jgi:Tol biopolymer transport system component
MVMNADGSNQAAVFTGLAFTGPCWSPDGRSLVFGGSSNGSSGVYAVDVAVVNGKPTASNLRLLQAAYHLGDPQWSPQGDLIAVAGVEVSPGVTGIVTFPTAGGTPVVRYSATPPRRTQWPTWSPDGTRIAFTEIDDVAGTSTLRILNLVSGELVDVVTLPPALIRWPDWSHDGASIAYSRHGGDGRENLYTVTAQAASTPVLVARGLAPSWSPDDRYLVHSVDGRSPAIAVVAVGEGISTTLAKDGITADWR